MKASIKSSLPGHRVSSQPHGHDLTHLRTVSPGRLGLKMGKTTKYLGLCMILYISTLKCHEIFNVYVFSSYLVIYLQR